MEIDLGLFKKDPGLTRSELFGWDFFFFCAAREKVAHDTRITEGTKMMILLTSALEGKNTVKLGLEQNFTRTPTFFHRQILKMFASDLSAVQMQLHSGWASTQMAMRYCDAADENILAPLHAVCGEVPPSEPTSIPEEQTPVKA